jgi:hypothetical protein
MIALNGENVNPQGGLWIQKYNIIISEGEGDPFPWGI